MNNNANNNNNNIPNINASAASAVGGAGARIVGGVDINNLLQANSFLQSDLSEFINIPPFADNNNVNVNANNLIMRNSPTRAAHATTNLPYAQLTNLTGGNNPYVTGSNSDQIVLNLNSTDENQQEQAQAQQQQHQQQQQQQQQHADQANVASNNLFMHVFKTMQSSLPFFLLFVSKIFHQHLVGFFIVLGFIVTLHWSNRTLVNQVELKVYNI
jgi:hypothetical protein